MRTTFILPGMFLLAACTQPPAQVVMHGGQIYAQNITRPSAPVVAVTESPVASASFAEQNAALAPAAGGTPSPVVSNGGPVVLHGGAIASSDLPPLQPGSAPASAAPAPVPAATMKPQSYLWPAEGIVTGRFGPQAGGQTADGIRISTEPNTPVVAVADGEVVFAANRFQNYGKTVVMKHAGGVYSTYANLGSIKVNRYDFVRQGGMIGQVNRPKDGKDGALYFALREGKQFVDPLHRLPSNVAGR